MGTLAGRRGVVILGAGNVVDLQYFLMDAAKRRGGGADSGALLSSAAALDYALLISSEHANETIDDSAPVAELIRDTMAGAAARALDVVQAMLEAPPEVFAEFAARNVRPGGVFDVVRELRASGAIVDGEIAFRLVTLTSGVAERLRRD